MNCLDSWFPTVDCQIKKTWVNKVYSFNIIKVLNQANFQDFVISFLIEIIPFSSIPQAGFDLCHETFPQALNFLWMVLNKPEQTGCVVFVCSMVDNEELMVGGCWSTNQMILFDTTLNLKYFFFKRKVAITAPEMSTCLVKWKYTVPNLYRDLDV